MITLREVAATLPPPAAYTGAAQPVTCSDTCMLLGASDAAPALAAYAGRVNVTRCTQDSVDEFFALDPRTLQAAAVTAMRDGLGAARAAQLQTANPTTMTPRAALAADALVGSLRARDGFVRITADAPCLAFPRDHGLHTGVADEWYFVVGVLTARGDGETTDTLVSFCWMLDFRLLAPPSAPDALGDYIVDAQFAVAEAGAPNAASSAAVWGGATPLTATAAPLTLRCGGMSLVETPSAAVDGLGAFTLRGVGGSGMASGGGGGNTLLDLTIARDPSTAPFTLELQRGIIGDTRNGNGYYYYSAPFLAVTGGAVITRSAAGVLTPRTVTGGIAWFDHQLGTVGAPASRVQSTLLATVAAAAPAALPMVDRGFGIAGQENWFGLMFTAGPLAGLAYMGTVIGIKPATALTDAVLNGNWIVPDGRGASKVTVVNGGTISATAYVTADSGARFASAFTVRIPASDAVAARLGGAAAVTLTATNLAADGTMQWSKGDLYSEAALVLRSDDGSSGVGWAEQVGWDTQSTAKLLAAAHLPNAAPSTWDAAPPAFVATGYWVLGAAAVLLLALLLLVVLGAARLVRRRRNKPSVPVPVPVPMPVPSPTPILPASTFVESRAPPPSGLTGGGVSGKPRADAALARWLL